MISNFYSDGIDYSHLKPNLSEYCKKHEITGNEPEGEFQGKCVYCGENYNVTITDGADICHECGGVYI